MANADLLRDPIMFQYPLMDRFGWKVVRGDGDGDGSDVSVSSDGSIGVEVRMGAQGWRLSGCFSIL